MKEILMPGVCVLSKHIHCRKRVKRVLLYTSASKTTVHKMI